MHSLSAIPEPQMTNTPLRPFGVVGAVDDPPQEESDERTAVYTWPMEEGAGWNYRRLGECLARRRDDLFRNGKAGQGIIQVLPDGTVRLIRNGAELAPVLVDSLTLHITKGGKIVGELPAAVHLNAMLKAECFLGQFRPVDRVSRYPIYQSDFSLVRPGHHQDRHGMWLLSVGPEPRARDGIATIARFLDAMAFAGPADRANAVAAALTVRLRHLWLGEKPLILVTGSKSHAGKSTVTDFVKGTVPSADLLYRAPCHGRCPILAVVINDHDGESAGIVLLEQAGDR